jgi:hypothetical protein
MISMTPPLICPFVSHVTNKIPNMSLESSHTPLTGTQFLDALQKLFETAEERLFISSAFCRSETFEALAKLANDEVKKRDIVVRWRLLDLLQGSSDLNVYPICKSLGWSLRIHQDLHAKVFLSERTALVGSGNLTNRGTAGYPPNGNVECGVQLPRNQVLDTWCRELILGSRVVDDGLFEQISEEVKTFGEEFKLPQFSMSLVSKIQGSTKIPLFTHDLFWSQSPQELTESSFMAQKVDQRHDLLLLGITPPVYLADIRKRFRGTLAFQWLEQTVDGEMYFGELSQSLHNALNDDPAPFRKDVKQLLSNLLNWVVEVGPPSFTIDRPNHSQRVQFHPYAEGGKS